MEFNHDKAYIRVDDPNREIQLRALELPDDAVGPFSVLAMHDIVLERLHTVSADRYTGDKSNDTLQLMGCLHMLQGEINDYINDHLK